MAKDARTAISRVFAAAGYSPHQIAGVLAHAERESGFDPNASGDKGASRGLFQWQGPRLKALKQFAAEQGGKASDPEVQAQFAVNELSGSEKAAGKALQSARDPREASIAMNRFERFSHDGGWKNAQGGESIARQQAALKYGGDENINVARPSEKQSPFDNAAQSVVDHMSKSTEGKRLQADYVNRSAPKPLEGAIEQAVAQNDEPAVDNPLVQQTSMRVPRAEGQPRYKARQEERAARGADATVSDMPPTAAKSAAPKPTTEDDIIRQVLREEQLGNEVTNATGLTPNGQPIDAATAFSPTSVSKVAAPLAGGSVPLAIAASDQGDQRQPVPPVQGFPDDPAMRAVEAQVGAKPQQSVDPNWLLEALGDTVLPAVKHAAANDPSVMPAADAVAKSVIRSMAVNDSQRGGASMKNDGGYYQRLASEAGHLGDSQEMLRAVQMDQAGQAPPMQMSQGPMPEQIPLPQPRPQDAPIDVSSYINGGGFEVG